MVAIEGNNLSMVKSLLNHGSYRAQKDRRGRGRSSSQQKVLQLAAERGAFDIVEELLSFEGKNDDEKMRIYQNWSLLTLILSSSIPDTEMTEIVEKLLKKGYEPTAVDKGYWGRKFENHPPVLQSVLWEQMNETERTYWGKVGFEGNNRKVLLFFCKYPHRIASKESWEKLMKYLCSETKLNHPLFKLILKWSYKLGDVRGDNGQDISGCKEVGS